MTVTTERTELSSGSQPQGSTLRSRSSRSGKSGSNMRYSAKLARRELRRRPWRALLVVLLIALPTWIMCNMAVQARTSIAAYKISGPSFSSDLVASFNDDSQDGEGGADGLVLQGDGFVQVDSGFAGPSTAMSSADIEAALPSGSTVQRVVDVVTSIMTEDGDVVTADFVKIDLSTEAAASWAPLSEGRAPEYGEVVLGSSLADRLDVGLGDTLRLRQPQGEWRVVGIAAASDDRLLAFRDFDESQLAVTSGYLLIDLPAGISAAEVDGLETQIGAWTPENSRFAIESPTDDESSESIALVWLVAMMLFLMFGVIIIAAFATIARGQLVMIGQLAANGAEHRFSRRVLALQGFWAGVVGVVLGGAAALATIGWVSPLIKATIYDSTPRLDWNPVDVVVIGLIGTIVATAAASLPALALVKTSVLDALAGRRPEHPVPRWMVPVGVGAFALGLLLLVVSARSGSNAGAAGAMIGALGIVIGVCLIGPLVIQTIGRLAGAMPLSIRISLRGLERARLRSAAVVSSIAVTTGVMAAIIAGLQTDARGPQTGEYANDVAVLGNLPSLVIRTADGQALLDDDGSVLAELPDDLDTVEISWAPAATSSWTEIVRSVLPGAAEHPIRAAVRPDGVYDNSDGAFVGDPDAEAEQQWSPGWGELPPGVGSGANVGELPLIADASTLSAYSLPASFRKDLEVAGYGLAIADGNCPDEYLWSDGGGSEKWDGNPVEAPADSAERLEPTSPAPIKVAGMECWLTAGPFMTEKFAADHGYQIVPVGTVFANPDPLTKAERNQLSGSSDWPSAFVGWDFAGFNQRTQTPAAESSVVAYSYGSLSSGVSIYVPSINADDFALVQFIMFGIAAVFVTVIAGIGLALAAADSRRDRAVLSVIGARPATRRRIAATDAWVLVMIGTMLGVPAALFATRVVTVATGQGRPTGVPWLFVGAEFIAIPILVAGLAYVVGLFRRSTPKMDVLQAD